MTIDGRLDEPCWKRAPAATGFVQLRNARTPALHSTTGYVVYDDTSICIGIDCEEPRMDLVREAAARTPGKFEYYAGETIEIFLDVNRDRKTFLQIMLNTNGTMQTWTTDPMQVRNVQVQSAVHFDTDRFSMECRVPFAFLHPRPNPDRTWGLNLCRSRVLEGRPGSDVPIGHVHSTWQNPGSEFRRPENFGDLRIDADLSAYRYEVSSRFEHGKLQLRVENRTGAGRGLQLEARVGDMQTATTRRLDTSPAQPSDIELPVAGGSASVDVMLRDVQTGDVRYIGGNQLTEQAFSVPAAPGSETPASPAQGYTVFAKHYLERGNHRTMPRPEQIGAALETFACKGEYEPASFAVRTERELRDVRVDLASDLAGPDGSSIPASAVDIRIVELMTRWFDSGTFERVECFLLRNRARDVPAQHTQRYWLTVHVPEQTEPGRYETQVRITPANAPASTLPLRVEVLPFLLGRATDMNYFMYFSLSYFPPSLRTSEYTRKVFVDMREHGMTSATLYAYPSATGWMSVDRDRAAWNLPMSTQMDLLRDTKLVAPWAAVPWIGAECYGSGVWKMVLDACERHGWPELLWYLIDEPNQARLDRVESCMARVAEFRQQYPGRPLRTTTAGAANPLVAHYYDVWIAGCYLDQETLARGRDMNKAIWTYDCGLAPVDAITDRHYFGIWTWAAGLKGTSHWAYYDAHMLSRWNLKAEWRDSEDDVRDYTHCLNYVYPKSDEIIPTIGWEAVREGVDDARYLLALERLVTAAREAGVAPELTERADTVLANIRGAVNVANLGVERTRCKELTKTTGRPRIRDFERNPPEPDLSPADYDRMRRDVAEQIVTLLDTLQTQGVAVDLNTEPERPTRWKPSRQAQDPDGPVNLLANPGFELGTDASAAGWTVWAPARVKHLDIARTAETAHTGAHSFRLTSTNGSLYQIVKLSPGATYQIGCWLKRDLAAGSVVLDVGLTDRGGKWYEGKSTWLNGPRLSGCADWEQTVTDALTVPADAVSAWIKISTSSDMKGSVWVDDVRVHRQPPTVAPEPAPADVPPAPPPAVTRDAGDESLLEACEDLNKVNAVFQQKHWDPKGTQPMRIGTITVSTEHKVQGSGSIHWVVTREDLERKRESMPALSLVSLDYLYGRKWGPINEVRFHLKCEDPNHPPLFAMLSASGASPVTRVLERGVATKGWKEVCWNVRDADIGVSEKWGKIVWLLRLYTAAKEFEPDDSIDLYIDNIRLLAAAAKDVTERSVEGRNKVGDGLRPANPTDPGNRR